jgi:hypothetical protein
MGIIELTVTACIHLVRSNLKDLKPISLGSGVIIRYKDRYFICTVSHFTDHDDENIGILTGRIKENQTEVYYLGDFSYLTKINFQEIPDAEDLIFCLENPDKSGEKLDIAFREISLLENIVQDKREFDLNGIGRITVNQGGKSLLIVDDDYEIDQGQLCSFFGRIRPHFDDRILNFQEALYWGLPIKSIGEEFIEMDLGTPIIDYSRFKGCSGAPIIDTCGRLIGLVTHGKKDPSKTSIFGFRFDKVKQWIDLMYFQEPIAGI